MGGAPIYGADAIAGTVNIILKKDYQGLDVDAQVGASGQGDAWNYRTASWRPELVDGRATSRRRRNDQDRRTRRHGAPGLFGGPAVSERRRRPASIKTVLTPAGSVPQVNFGGIPMVDDAFCIAAGIGLRRLPTGASASPMPPVSYSVRAQAPARSLQHRHSDGQSHLLSGGDGLRLSQVSNLLSPTERINFDTLMHFQDQRHVNALRRGLLLRNACDRI